jgi:hypothetical protein
MIANSSFAHRENRLGAPCTALIVADDVERML